MATQKTETRTDRSGLVPGVAHLALDVADRSQSTAIALVQDARGELRALADGTIDLADKAAASLFRFARKVTQRIDEGVAETLGNVERLIGGAVKAARETTRATQDLVHTAAAGLGGSSAAA